MKTFAQLILAGAVTTLLSACGGGGGNSTTTPTVKVTVSNITADQLAYRKTTNFTITGENLDKGINASIPGCLKITELAGSTATQKVLSCKIVAVGSFTATITDAANASLNSKSFTVALAAQPQVTMKTSMGDVVFELDPAKAPVSVDNFLQYVENGFYVNKIFHRVIKDFVVQGGGLTSDLNSPPTLTPIKLEASNGLSNVRGTLAMARTQVADSATSQFYINVVDNSKSLDAANNPPGYAVFGKVVKGMDVVDAMRQVQVVNVGSYDSVPVTPIFITSAVQTQ